MPVKTLEGYKLMRQRADGTLGPLFINRTLRVPLETWLWAREIPTPGYVVRKGWHGTLEPVAPHLAEKPDRVWCRCEFAYYRFFERPVAQGSTWILAQRMRVIEVLNA